MGSWFHTNRSPAQGDQHGLQLQTSWAGEPLQDDYAVLAIALLGLSGAGETVKSWGRVGR